MATLHVRDVPMELYARLQELAQADRRSLNSQVITLLEQSVHDRETRRTATEILAAIRRRRATYARPAGAPDSVELLREDRER